MMQLYGIILAGGSGSRLWPLSRESFPKQMLKLYDSDGLTLLQRTFLNLSSIVNDKNIVTAVNVKYASSTKEQLKKLQEKFYRNSEYTVLTEPISKNTTAAVALAAKYIYDNLLYFSQENPIFIVVPSDEIFANRNILSQTIEKAVPLAQNGYIVAFGTNTSIFDENMSYFKARKNNNLSQFDDSALKVSHFIDKPQNYDDKILTKGKTYVNTGIYMFSFDTYMNELKRNSKKIYNCISNCMPAKTIPSIPLCDYENLENVSIEESIIANSKKIALFNLDTQWKDIGSWEAIYDVCPKDENGNCLIGKIVDTDSTNSLIYSNNKLVASLGLHNMIIVSTEDASFICDKNHANDIKQIYHKLNDNNSCIKDIHKTVYRPWGYYTVLENGDGFMTKCITVNPKAKLSLQKHFHRSEHWIVLEGLAVVIKGNDRLILNEGESVDIDIEEVHSLQNESDIQLKILEVQLGDILDENDIERIEDIYGRV